MARIRTIKPEFPQSESMGNVSRDARLLFIQLWTICDDSGRARGKSRMLASLLFPYDDDAPALIDGWLEELEREGCIIRYEIDETAYLQLCNWLKHQKIDKPTPSKIPPFVEGSRLVAKPREDSSVDVDRGPKDQGKKHVAQPSAFDAKAYLVSKGVSDQVADDWLKLRKKKKAEATQTAIDGVAREAAKAGWSLVDALSHCCAKGWQGFDAGWITPAPQQSGLPGLARAI